MDVSHAGAEGAAALGFLIAVETVSPELRSSMLYFQVVILAAVVMLVYYCEFTDTFSPAHRGFMCGDPALTKPDPGPEQDSRIQPVILYSVVGGLPVVLVSTNCMRAENRRHSKRQYVMVDVETRASTFLRWTFSTFS